jgi:superfamily II DNA/RNA helicase
MTGLQVDHVVMFDFPSTGVDFLHRAGRTARAGRKGLVSCIIRQKDKDFVYLIENALRNGKNIENLDRKMSASLRKSIEETVRAKRKEAKEKRRDGDESSGRRSEHNAKLGSRSRSRTSTVKKHVPIEYPRI